MQVTREMIRQFGGMEAVESQAASEPPPVPSIADLAVQVRAKLNADSQRDMDATAADYPNYEIRSWPDQGQEARVLLADDTAPTPALTPIANMRDLAMAELCARVVAKADIHRSAAARCIGLRRRLEDEVAAVEAAGDRVALEAIVWSGPSQAFRE